MPSAVRPDDGGRLSAAQAATARDLALLHWRYFDHFVGAETQWLVPDNIQEEPGAAVAMRTSPTNIGLQLLAIGSARDLGFITTEDMTRRLELVFRTLERMRAVPRALLQLVRPARPACPRACLHLHRGQRQPRGPPARGPTGLPGCATGCRRNP
jgi:hypothetical protein